jgi:hypothetical protein
VVSFLGISFSGLKLTAGGWPLTTFLPRLAAGN